MAFSRTCRQAVVLQSGYIVAARHGDARASRLFDGLAAPHTKKMGRWRGIRATSPTWHFLYDRCVSDLPTARLACDVDVVADHAAMDSANRRADETALDLVAAGRSTENRPRGRADRGVTLGVLFDDHRCRRRVIPRVASARSRRARRRAAPRCRVDGLARDRLNRAGRGILR